MGRTGTQKVTGETEGLQIVQKESFAGNKNIQYLDGLSVYTMSKLIELHNVSIYS